MDSIGRIEPVAKIWVVGHQIVAIDTNPDVLANCAIEKGAIQWI